jgi:hypothetical protein
MSFGALELVSQLGFAIHRLLLISFLEKLEVVNVIQ